MAAPAAQAATPLIQAESYSMQYGTGTRTTVSNLGPKTTYVGYISNNDWTAYDNVDFGSGLQNVTLTWSSYEGELNPGKVEVHVDGLDLSPVVTFNIGYTGSWSTFAVRSMPLPYAITGVHQVELRYVTNTGKDFMNLDSFQFS